MKKEWFFDKFCGVQLVAYAEDGRLVELGSESEQPVHKIGNIYKGRVMNVVAGMQAAFVACGMEKNCYLSLSESGPIFSRYDGTGNAEPRPTLEEGDEILVQLVKPARGSKGAKVTSDLSIVGKHLIYLPRTDFVGISRKITEEETRARLLKEAVKLKGSGEGFIVRTAATEATSRHLKTESEYLRRMYLAACEQAKTAPVGTAVYREYDLPVKVMRDSLGGVGKIYVGDRELYEKILQLVRLRSDFAEKNVILHTGKRTMFSEYGLSEQIFRLADPRVELENGGDIVIDRTEAMTVIDVNTGKYTGESDLESTVYETNLLAAKEIAHQVRLRNIGGIVAVDFIDMAETQHCREVEKVLTDALASDRAKCRVLPMNELCVTLFTRKRTAGEFPALMLKPCPHCTRQGFVFSDVFMAMQIRSALTDCFASGYPCAVVELNRGLSDAIVANGYFAEAPAVWEGKDVYLIPHRTYHEESYSVRGAYAPPEDPSAFRL